MTTELTHQPATSAPTGPLSRLADFCYRHRGRVVAVWTLTLVVGLGLLIPFGGAFSTDSSTGGSESQHAYQLLQERFPQQGGDAIEVVIRAPDGVRDASVRSQFESLLQRAATTPHVTGVVSPYSAEGAQQISADGRIAFATLQLDVAAADVPTETVDSIAALADAAESPGVDVALAGAAVSEAQSGPPSEAIALIAAAVVLFIAFGSLAATGLPILTALFGLGVAAAAVGLLMNVIDVGSTAPAIAAMVGLGVGIDYALLILSRYRGYLAAGAGVRGAIVAAVSTAGRSVVFAGSTVVIALLGMFLMRESYLYGLTIATVLAVIAMIFASVTLLPALLAFTGRGVDRFRVPFLGRREHDGADTPARRWSGVVLRHPWTATVGSIVLLLVLTAPILGLRLGLPDAGNDPKSYTTRQAYDLLSEGFGPGTNGPLVLAAELPDGTSVRTLERVAERDLPAVKGVASVSSPMLSPGGDVAVIQVLPTTGPQAEETADLVHRLRDDALPRALRGSGITVSVGGATAASVDMTTTLGERLPWFVAASILLSVLLLVALLRSPVIAVKAALMNLLSVGAAFGVVSYAVGGTWLGSLIGIPEEIPVPVYAPLLMFAILFGLSMDYEIFLMSRIREEYVRSKDNTAAIIEGIAGTARVIAAAAAVMVAVFAAFIFSQEMFLKAVGIGMASAILIDATVVRLVLVPAALKLLGDANWWMPRWLDRILPTVSSEGQEPELLPDPPVWSGRHRSGRTSSAVPVAAVPVAALPVAAVPVAAAAPVAAVASSPPAVDLVRQRGDASASADRVELLAAEVQLLRAEVRQLVEQLSPGGRELLNSVHDV